MTNYLNTDMEKKAYLIALLWDETISQELPEYKTEKVKRKGDPKKSLVFKYAYKLAQETNGIIDDYKSYILAQIQILKALQDVNGAHALIAPQCIVGPKAWKRWNYWKKQQERIRKIEIQSKECKTIFSLHQIKVDLEKTKFFLIEKFKCQPTYEQIAKAVKDFVIIRWTMLGIICPFYVLLSPYVKKSIGELSIDDFISYDLNVYRQSITDEVKREFRNLFYYEFVL
jgi:hypothetical protein